MYTVYAALDRKGGVQFLQVPGGQCKGRSEHFLGSLVRRKRERTALRGGEQGYRESMWRLCPVEVHVSCPAAPACSEPVRQKHDAPPSIMHMVYICL